MPSFLAGKIIKIYPGVESDFLFSTRNFTQITYSTLNKSFKRLISISKIKGNFSSHSLRRGGTTAMRAAGVPLSHIKERGQWVSDCVFKYIKPSVRQVEMGIVLRQVICLEVFWDILINIYHNIYMSKQITDFLVIH